MGLIKKTVDCRDGIQYPPSSSKLNDCRDLAAAKDHPRQSAAFFTKKEVVSFAPERPRLSGNGDFPRMSLFVFVFFRNDHIEQAVFATGRNV